MGRGSLGWTEGGIGLLWRFLPVPLPLALQAWPRISIFWQQPRPLPVQRLWPLTCPGMPTWPFQVVSGVPLPHPAEV